MPESSRSSRHSESGAESSGEEDADNETPVSDYVSLSQSQGNSIHLNLTRIHSTHFRIDSYTFIDIQQLGSNTIS